MIVLRLIFLCSFVASVHCGTFAWVVSLKFTNSLVNVGDQVVLTCTVRNTTHSHTVHFYKEGRSSNGSLVKFDLSTNEESHYPSSNLQISRTDYGTDVDYVLSMQATTGSTGNYSCAVRNSTMMLSNLTAEVNVLMYATSVRLLVNNTDVSNSTVNVTLGSSYNLQCIVNGSNPSAIIQITHGNQDLTSQITSLVNGSAMYAHDFDQTDSPFLQTVTRSVNATISAWKVDATYLDAPLTCFARVPTLNIPQMASFTPRIGDAPPQFFCNDTFVIPTQASSFLEITCQVYSKPPLTGASFSCGTPPCTEFSAFPAGSWYPTSAGDTVFSGMVKPIVSSGPMNITKANMTFKIQAMSGQGLVGRTYIFKAVNSQATVMHQVKLIGTSPGQTTGGAARTLSSITPTILISVTVLMVQMMMNWKL